MKNENDFNSQNELNGYPIQNTELKIDTKIVSEPPVEKTTPEISNAYMAGNTPIIGREIESGNSNPEPVKEETPIATQMPNAIPEENEIFEDLVKNKGHKSKMVIIVTVVVLLIVAALGGAYFFLTSTHTAEKFLDQKVKDINTWINNLNNSKEVNNSDNTYDMLKDDLKSNFKLEITTDNEAISFLDGFKIEAKESMSLEKEIMDLNINIKEKTNLLLNANVYLDKDNLYIEESNILPTPLKNSNQENYFKKFKDNFSNKVQSNGIKDMIKNIMNNLGEILKLADISTKNSGLYVEYTYDINENNIPKIKAKLLSLMKEEESFNSLLALIGEENFTLTIEPIKVIVKQNIITNNIDEIVIENEEGSNVLTKVGEGKYRIGTNDSTYSEITFDETKLVLTDYVDKKVDFQITIEAKDDNINARIKSEDLTISLDIKTKTDSANNKEEFNISLKIDIAGSKLNIDCVSQMEYDQNFVTKKEIANAKDINSLTEEEREIISNNFLNKLQSSEIYKSISGLMGTSSVEDIPTNM